MRKSTHDLVSLLLPAQITPAYFFILLLANSLSEHVLELTVAIFFSSLVQMASLLLYMKTKKIDIFISNRKDRPQLFLIALLSYAVGFVLLLQIRATFIVAALMLAYVINTLAAAAINFVDKVSIHVWGISGPAVAILYQYGYPAFFATLLVALLVGISRVKVKAHTPRQVAIAFLASVPLTYLVIYYLAPFVA